jgi:hypothetical protein
MSKAGNPLGHFNSSPEVIRLVVMMYVRFPLSLRYVEDLLFERGIDICHETVRLWWNRFGPLFAADIRRQRVSRMRGSAPAMASGRGVREDRWRDALSAACGRSCGRCAGELSHDHTRQGGGSPLHEEGTQAPRLS